MDLKLMIRNNYQILKSASQYTVNISALSQSVSVSSQFVFVTCHKGESKVILSSSCPAKTLTLYSLSSKPENSS